MRHRRSSRLRVPRVALLVPLLLVAGAVVAHANRTTTVADIDLDMTQAQVVRRMGPPVSRSQSAGASVWQYQDGLTVYIAHDGYPRGQVVVGVRTLNPRDRARRLRHVHVGSPERALHAQGIACAIGWLRAPTGARQVGRYCQSPIWRTASGRIARPAGQPILVFKIRDGRIAEIRSQFSDPGFPP